MLKKIAVLTAGGDAPGMNVAIRAIVRTALTYNIETYGVLDGYAGIIKEEFVKLSRDDVSDVLSKGGTILGSDRFEVFKELEIQKQAASILKKHHFDALICIGGDGTYQGALALSKLDIPTITIPGTIDNDINSTEYTIGFDTTLNTIVDCVDKLRDTIRSHRKCAIVEVMGRYCPDLAIRAGICCGAEYVLTDKANFDKEKLLDTIHNASKQNKRGCLVIIAENTIPIHEIEKIINDDGTYPARISVLGYIQRGGSPSAYDRVLASRLGSYAVELLNEGTYNVSVGVKGDTLINTPLDAKLEPKQSLNLLRWSRFFASSS